MADKPELYIDTGGMFRCCIKHLQDTYLSTPTYSPQEGDIETCQYCKEGIRYSNGVWKAIIP